MPSEVILPRVDMDMATGKIAKWFVEPGAQVTKGQPLFEIETDKAAMEIEAPATGTIRDLASASGADIPVGSVVAWIFGDGEGSAPASARAAPSDAAKAPAPPTASDSRLDIEPVAVAPSSREPAAEANAGPGRPRATPIARRLARERGLDLGSLRGTGPRGRIQAADVTAGPQNVDAVASTPAGTMGDAAAVDTPATQPSPPPAPAPAMPRTGGPLNIVRLRDGEGRPTLLVHGFGADLNNWRPLLAGHETRRPVLAVDLPGHGASALGAVTDFATLVEAVEAGLAASGLGGINLVGHSLGGGVAAALAARATLDIRNLLLLSPTGLGPDINGAFLRGFLGATAEASLTPWMQQLVADPASITPTFVRATLKARVGTDLVATQRRIAEAVFPDDTQAFSVLRDLAGIAVPTRVVFGTADRILPFRHTADLPGGVALHRLVNVGHMPQLEAANLVGRIMDQMAG